MPINRGIRVSGSVLLSAIFSILIFPIFIKGLFNKYVTKVSYFPFLTLLLGPFKEIFKFSLYMPEARGSNPRCAISLRKCKKSVTIAYHCDMLYYSRLNRSACPLCIFIGRETGIITHYYLGRQSI